MNQHNGAYIKEDSRKFLLNFTYKIGQNVAGSRKRSTASDEEKNRVR
jgi:hypothetical protein